MLAIAEIRLEMLKLVDVPLVIDALVLKKLVEVELVIVPLVTFTVDTWKLGA